MILGLIPNYIPKKKNLTGSWIWPWPPSPVPRPPSSRTLRVSSDHHLRLLYHDSWQRWPTNIQRIAIVPQTLIIYLSFFDRASRYSGFACDLVVVTLLHFKEIIIIYFWNNKNSTKVCIKLCVTRSALVICVMWTRISFLRNDINETCQSIYCGECWINNNNNRKRRK